jgi:NAD(P)-dependent dehydrogenase (short-subunit alcohol dehydrogenase family)
MIHNMTEEEWDGIIEVHLRGHFNVVRATINHFRSQNEGAYVIGRRAPALSATSVRPITARPKWA